MEAGFIYNENDALCGSSKLILTLWKKLQETTMIVIPSKICRLQVVTFLSPSILNLLPIQSHQIITPERDFIENINQALDLLDTVPTWTVLSKFLEGVCVLQIKPNHRHKDIEITSLSVPVFPFVSFISRKAVYHTPPLNIRPPAPLYVAENLLHEATHQALNLNLIEKDIFMKNYTSQTSPLVEIPWRKNQSVKRNKKWQIDRVLHACVVYVMVASFRKGFLKKTKKFLAVFWVPGRFSLLSCNYRCFLFFCGLLPKFNRWCLFTIRKGMVFHLLFNGGLSGAGGV